MKPRSRTGIVVAIIALLVLVFGAQLYGLTNAAISNKRAAGENAARLLDAESQVAQLGDQVRSLGGKPVVTPGDVPEPVPGPEGAPGLVGLPGVQGLPGINGLPGVDGQRGPRGATGAKGDDGDLGRLGPAGNTGEPGATGDTGGAGDTGATGEPGEPGATGSTGNTGARGSQGERGVDGKDGAAGERGPRGEPAFPFSFAFESSAGQTTTCVIRSAGDFTCTTEPAPQPPEAPPSEETP